VAFLALPVVVAFVVPFLLLGGRLAGRSFNPLALIPLTAGLGCLEPYLCDWQRRE
jgi:hypothetical protein